METEIHIYSSRARFVQETAKKIAEIIMSTVKMGDRCSVALAGGNTPRDVYARLASPAFRDLIQWDKVDLFWGDERMVPSNHQDSNYAMAAQALLQHISIPEENVHRIKGELEPEKAASEYADVITGRLSSPPRFDLVLLGLGTDGHTASLFPGRPALQEHTKPVVAGYVQKLDAWRVSLTLPVLNNAREVVFMVSGEDKAEMVKKIVYESCVDADLPASLVRPDKGIVRWMMDAEAARL